MLLLNAEIVQTMGTGPLLPWPQGHVPQADLPVAVPFTLCQSVNVRELKGLRSYAIRKARVIISLEFCWKKTAVSAPPMLRGLK